MKNPVAKAYHRDRKKSSFVCNFVCNLNCTRRYFISFCVMTYHGQILEKWLKQKKNPTIGLTVGFLKMVEPGGVENSDCCEKLA